MEYFDAIGECDAHIIYNEGSYTGNSALYEFEASMAKGENTKVYFIERPNPNKMIEQKGDIDEAEKQDIREFCELLDDMEKHGVLRIGIEQLYKDFNIKKQSIDRDEEER